MNLLLDYNSKCSTRKAVLVKYSPYVRRVLEDVACQGEVSKDMLVVIAAAEDARVREASDDEVDMEWVEWSDLAQKVKRDLSYLPVCA